MKVLVTGGTGFLGRHLTGALSKISEVYISNSKHANLHDYDSVRDSFAAIKFDYIYHLAAQTKAGDYCLTHKGEQWINNQLLNTNILRFWAEYQPQAKMIAMGTSCMYEPSNDFLREDYCLKGEPELGLITYAHTKRMLLVGLQSLASQYGLQYTYFIPSTLYGDGFEIGDGHFIFDLVKKIHAAKHTGQDAVLWGDGYQRRELIYIHDVVDIILRLRDLNNQVVNLGTGCDNSIREFASCVCKYIGYDSNLIKYDTTKYVGAQVKKLSSEKLLSILPADFKFTSIDLGIGQTVKYYSSIKTYE